jgi:glycosyltransferase involved in cell wall biosynthesis
MKILMLVNWKIKYCDEKPADKQPPDYKVEGKDYWFYRYFKNKPEVDVIDIRSFPWLENFERNKLHFYIWQAIRAIPKLNQYDLIVSHGMPSAIVICLWRRFFKTKAKHVVFDIGSFASASESGFSLKLMQFASKSLDGLIYHMSAQRIYYEKFFPWIVDKSQFIKFGADFDFFGSDRKINSIGRKYIVCAGKNKCDWDTVVKAYKESKIDLDLHLIGGKEERFENISGVVQIPYLPINDFIEQVHGAEFCVLPLEPVPFSFGQMRLLQQMALKKCVIVSNAPSILDYVEDGITAKVYKTHHQEELKRIMRWAVEKERGRENIANNAYNFVKDECNEEKMANNIECFNMKLLNK